MGGGGVGPLGLLICEGGPLPIICGGGGGGGGGPLPRPIIGGPLNDRPGKGPPRPLINGGRPGPPRPVPKGGGKVRIGGALRPLLIARPRGGTLPTSGGPLPCNLGSFCRFIQIRIQRCKRKMQAIQDTNSEESISHKGQKRKLLYYAVA